MESRLEEVKEEIEHLDHVPAGRLKVVVTVAVLLVTFATTAGALLAAKAAARESEAQRQRQQMSAQAVAASIKDTSSTAIIDQQRNDSSEAGWRRTFLDLVATDPSTAGDTKAQVQSEAAASEKQRVAIDAGLPVPYSKLQAYEATLAVPTDLANQTAQARATESAQWLGKEDVALSTVSMLALALFLLGLALTISTRGTAKGFVALALVLLLVSVGRLADVAARGVTVPTGQAITAYAKGNEKLADGDYPGAIGQFKTAVHLSPGYESAWEQLANAEFDQSTPAGYAASERYFAKALDLKPSESKVAPLYNNLGFSQLVDGHLQAAATTLHTALSLDPTNEVTLASLAEQRVLAHDSPSADQYLAQALAIVARHGSYFRQQYFEAFRSDQDTFAVAGVPPSVTDAFYTRVKQAEASLDSLGSANPGDAHGATVTNIVTRPVTGAAGKAGLATVGFDYTGFQADDHLALRWYEDGVTYELTDSQPNSVLDASAAGNGAFAPDAYNVPVPEGSQTVEIYLNGVLLGSSTFNMPAGAPT
ncbi:MAG TPA: tetratricopeptide repeat protein [Acidimicrobiales bacterium]|nr:tetratricopeptide repeat protein [Acidimicrobiales bacterium]